MKIITKTKNLELTEALEAYIEEKITPLKKFINVLKQDTPDGLKTLAEVFIEIEKETIHHRKGDIFSVRAQINLPGKGLNAQAKTDDLYGSIIKVKDELKTEIEKYKVKKIDVDRRKQRKAKDEIEI